MSRNAPAFTTTRAARFTTASHDEVELTHPFEGIAGHQDNGRKMHAYYSPEHYAARQAQHGHDIYPVPTPFQP